MLLGCVPPAVDSPSTDVENKYKYSEECEDLPPCNVQLSISTVLFSPEIYMPIIAFFMILIIAFFIKRIYFK